MRHILGVFPVAANIRFLKAADRNHLACPTLEQVMAESVQAAPPSRPPHVGNTAAMAEAVRGVRVDRRFYMAMALCAIVIAALGFAPSGLDPTSRRGPLTPLVVAHAAMFIAWLALFFVQTALVARRQIGLHRRLGIVTMLLAPVMIVSGYMVAITMARRGFDLSGDLGIDADPLLGLVNPLGDLITFGILVAGGYWYRQRRDVHKRLMLLATVGGLMLAPLAHLIGHLPLPREMAPIVLIPMAFLLFASAAYDRISLGRIHPVSLWGATAILIWDLLRNIAAGPSTAWHQFAQWLIS
jgi:uncharacterized membrane protein YozB (DUF420 family)